VDAHIHHDPREFAAYRDEPLPQRPAGSSGKRGRCELAFHVRQGKTHLQHSFVSHPFHFTHPWHLDPVLPDMAVVYVQTPGGGLIQGDRATLRFTLAPSARVHITTQAAEKIHAMTANCALQHVSFTLAADTYAEYCPEPVILFPQSRFAQTLHIELDARAWFFGKELFLMPEQMARFEAFANGLTARDTTSGRLLLHERSLALPMQQGLDAPGILAGQRVWGQAVLIGPQVSPAIVKDLAGLMAAQPGVMCGVTGLPRERGIAVKVLAARVPAARQALDAAWNFLRLHWLQAPTPQFPK
jgi:urease accessory protein